MNLTNFVSLFLDIYRIYYYFSKFSSKLNWINIHNFARNWKTKSSAWPTSERLGPPQRFVCTCIAHRCGPRVSAHTRQRPNAGRPTRAPTIMQNRPRLPTKWTRGPYHYFTLSLTLALNPPQFTMNSCFEVPGWNLIEVAASPAKRQRARTSSAAILTTTTLLITSAFDRGNKHHDWCLTEAWPCTTVGFGHGDTDVSENP